MKELQDSKALVAEKKTLTDEEGETGRLVPWELGKECEGN